MSKLLGGAILALAWAVSAAADSDKIRVIIIDGQNNHDWRSTTPWMKKVLEDSGPLQRCRFLQSEARR